MAEIQINDYSGLNNAVPEWERYHFLNSFKGHSTDGVLTIRANDKRIIITDIIVSGGSNLVIAEGSTTILDIDYTTIFRVDFTKPLICENKKDVTITNTSGKIFVNGFYANL